MTHPIPAWIKKGALAFFTFTSQVVEIQGIEADDLIAVRRARSTGNLMVLHTQLKPATIDQVIDFALAAQRIDEIKSILPHGKEENRFRVQFLGHISPAAITRMNAIVPDVFLDAELDGDAYIVTVKPEWLAAIVVVDPVTPAMLAQAEAEAAAVRDQVVATAATVDEVDMLDIAAQVIEQAEVEDEELAETARVIKELQERNQRLQDELAEKIRGGVHQEKVIMNLTSRNDALAEQVDSLIAHIDGMEDHAEAVAESVETSISTRPLTGCTQLVSKRGINDADLQKLINEGWEPQHFQFSETGDLNVVLTRDQVAPAPAPSTRTAAKLIESASPLVSFHMTQAMNQPDPALAVNKVTTTPPRNFASIASDRVRLQNMLNDPDTTQFDFSLAVEKSNLSRDERNTFISSFRTHRTGEVLAAHMQQRPSGHNPFKSLGEVSR
jgi:hypothetical protein